MRPVPPRAHQHRDEDPQEVAKLEGAAMVTNKRAEGGGQCVEEEADDEESYYY